MQQVSSDGSSRHSPKQLDNNGVSPSASSTENTWVEVSCQRTVAGEQYGKGLQDYNWSVSAPSVWYPSKSYFRYELELYGPGDPTTNPPATNPPKLSDQLAFAENCVSNSITNAYMYAGGQVVSSVVNSYPQCAAVAYRTGKTAAWMKNQGSAYGQHGTLSERIAAVSATTSGGAPIGLSGLDDNRSEVYKPCATSNAATLTFSFAGGNNDVPTLTSGATAAGVATAFQDGVLDAGVKIVLGGVTFVIASVAPGANGVQVISCVKGGVSAGFAANATSDWYAIRRALRRSDQARHKIQVLYQPGLGIFSVDQAMGSGSYRISLSPDPNFRLSMVETKDPGYALTGADTRYQVVVRDVKFFAAVGKLSIPDEIVQLDLMEYAAYSKVMSTATQNLQFTIPASTETIYVALQSPSAGSNPAHPPSKFTADNDSDLNLESIQITYANMTKTMTRWTSEFSAGTNRLVQLYNMSLQETHRDESPGGAESFNQWLDRGPLYAFKFDRDSAARDTEMTIQIAYKDAEAGTFDNQSKLFIIAEYRRLVELTHSNGQVVQVIARDV